jgi:lon-related putative ATP-dependent protease
MGGSVPQEPVSQQLEGPAQRGAAASAPTWRSGVPLPASQLYRACDLSQLDFETVLDLPDLPGLVGQDRAVEAVKFSIGIARKGFNVFALGPGGTGKHTLVRELLRQKASAGPTPPDWCYVNNFADPHRPRRLMLPAGRGKPLKDAMERLVADLQVALPAAFERDDYRARRDVLEQEFKKRTDEAFGGLQHRAEEKNIALIRTPMGLALAPTHNGEVISPDGFRRMAEADRKRIGEEMEELQKELEAIVRQIPDWEREHRDAVRQLNRSVTAQTVSRPFAELRKDYTDLPDVTAYLDAVEHDILENADDFLAPARAEADGESKPSMMEMLREAPTFRRYQVNVMVDNGATKGAPVVFEDHPTHQALVGRIEHLARFGALMTDFSLIVPGALHRANGGYLVLDGERLVTSPFSWESLKRALRSGEIRLLTLEQLMSLQSTVSLEPEPIPLDVKVVLIGSPMLYYLLAAYDPDFAELFKVAADFDDTVDRTPESSALYARAIAATVRREKLRPLDRDGVARAIEHTSRLSGDSEKLSAQMQGLIDLLQEADYIAGTAGRDRIGRAELQAAIDAQHRRGDRVYQRLQEEIGRNTLRIESVGTCVGQVNGLAVMGLGGFMFGHPSRISARVRVGRGEVIDIERQVALGGPLHSKGVLILSGFLGGRFGKSAPLSLTASLVFEQSYGGIDGDSASSAELYALLSALADVPIRQCFAVTGSVDQHGFVQAIGGVNEKIEGFFDVCNRRGLDGNQGVLIPASNVKHLMLRQDVVDACGADRFHVIPVETIDQGIEILTGVSAGEPDVGGRYPEGTINQRIALRLAAFAARGEHREPPRRRRERQSRRERDND